MKKVLFVSVLVILLFVSCSTMKHNPIVKLSLDENPTTGYRWELVTDDNVLELIVDEFVPSGIKGLVGAGGVRTFTFEVLKPEDTTILLYYRRSWEDFPLAPDKVFYFNSETNELEEFI